MFERLVELLLHAKTGLLAGVFLLGATGALVTATVENGVTTITITTASPTGSATASPTSTATASPTATATASPTASPSSSPKASSSPSACADEAHTINAAVQQVDTAFSQFHTSLSKLHESTKDANRATLSTADNMLKQIRQDAVKAIHATRTCAGASNEDKDNDENDQDEDSSNESGKHSSQQNFLLLFFSNLLGRNTTTTTASPTPTATPSGSTSTTVTFSGTDPKAIADEAVAAMKLVFDNATAQLESATPAPNPTKGKAPTARPERTAKPSHGHDGHEDDD